LEKTLAPRELLFKSDAGKTNNAPLLPFEGTQVILEYLPGDAEVARAASSVNFILESSKWIVVEIVPRPDLFKGSADGVVITVAQPTPAPLWTSEITLKAERNSKAADVFISFLESEGWVARRQMGFAPESASQAGPKDEILPPNTIRISVGFKPSPYFLPQWVKDVEKRTREGIKRGQENKKRIEDEIKRGELPAPKKDEHE
jgi:hypothetical protein